MEMYQLKSIFAEDFCFGYRFEFLLKGRESDLFRRLRENSAHIREI
jgi:hypothetical protein